MTKKKCINKALYKLERKAHILPLILFTAVTTILLVVSTAIYPYMKDSLTFLPEELQSLVSFDSAKEYFNAEAIEMWVVFGAVYATWLAIKLTTGDFKNGNAEMLYSLNMSRTEILRTKLLRLVINISIYNIVLALVSFFSLWIFCGEVAVVGILIFTLFAWIATMIIGLLMFGWGIMGKRRFNVFVGIVLVVVFYLISSISVSASQVEWLGFLSPFTALFGDVISNGFTGLLNFGGSLIIWGFVAIGTLIFSIISFKNVDLD